MTQRGKAMAAAAGLGVLLLACAAAADEAAWGEPVFTLKRVGQFDHTNNVTDERGVLGAQPGDTATPSQEVTWRNGTRIRFQLWVSAPGGFAGGAGACVDAKALVTVEAAKNETTKSMEVLLDSWTISDGYMRLGSGTIALAPGKASSCTLAGRWQLVPQPWNGAGNPTYRYLARPAGAGLDAAALAKAQGEGRCGKKFTGESFHPRSADVLWCGPVSGRFQVSGVANQRAVGSAAAAYVYEGVTRKVKAAAPAASRPRPAPPPPERAPPADAAAAEREEQRLRLRALSDRLQAAMLRLIQARLDLLESGREVENLEVRMGVAVAGAMDEGLTAEARALVRERLALMRDQRTAMLAQQDKLVAQVAGEQEELTLQLRLAWQKTTQPAWRLNVARALAAQLDRYELLPLRLYVWAKRADKVDAIAADLVGKSGQRKSAYRLWAARYLMAGDAERAAEKLGKVLAIDSTDALALAMLKDISNQRPNDAADKVLDIMALYPLEAQTVTPRASPPMTVEAAPAPALDKYDDAWFRSINGYVFGPAGQPASRPAAAARAPVAAARPGDAPRGGGDACSARQ